MKNKYISPDAEVIRLTLTRDVLRVSEDERPTSGGVIHEPDPNDELIDDGL